MMNGASHQGAIRKPRTVGAVLRGKLIVQISKNKHESSSFYACERLFVLRTKALQHLPGGEVASLPNVLQFAKLFKAPQRFARDKG